jgi:hypothetical protein
MSAAGPGPEFWKRADAVIDLAKEQSSDAPRGNVGLSLLYAAARFNAYFVAVKAKGRQEMETEREIAIACLTDYFKAVLTENLGDYIENFDEYMAKRQNQ